MLEEGVQSVQGVLPFRSGNDCLLWLLPIKADVCGHGEGKTPQKNSEESLGAGPTNRECFQGAFRLGSHHHSMRRSQETGGWWVSHPG